jgi:hypothetical protein
VIADEARCEARGVRRRAGGESRFFCSMVGSVAAVTGRSSFWDECRSGNSALRRGVGACYVQCSCGRDEADCWVVVGVLRLRECSRFASALAPLRMTGRF